MGVDSESTKSATNARAVTDAQRGDGEPNVRSRLLAKAGPVFANLGFDRATLREICGEADVNIASVAYYFGDKMGLYRAVIREVRDQREQRFPFLTSAGDVQPRENLTRLVHTMLSRMLTGDDDGWEAQLLMRETNHPTTAFKELAEEFFRPIFQHLKSTFACLIQQSKTDRGETTNQPVPDYVLEQLALSVVGQCFYYGFGRGVIDLLISPEQKESNFHVDSLCKHITAVMITSATHPSFEQERRSIESTIQLIKNQSENK